MIIDGREKRMNTEEERLNNITERQEEWAEEMRKRR